MMDLFHEHMGLVDSAARRTAWRYRRLDVEDLKQEGFLGLLHAARNYDPARGAKFQTYAVACIRGSMLGLITGEVGGRWPSTELTDDLDFLANRVPIDRPREGEMSEDLGEIRSALSRMDPRRGEVIRRYFGFGCEAESLAAIGRSLGLGREKTWRLGQQGLIEIRRAVNAARMKRLSQPQARKAIA